MSSSPTAPTSTTSSSTSSGFEAVARVALVACGALAQPAARIASEEGWAVDVHPLPPLLHNRPDQIADAVRETAVGLLASYETVVVGYADCGTYGALDAVCDELGLERLPGLHCYDVFAGASRIEAFFADQPGTFLLTDFLARSFARSVEQELGLDRYPELRDTYFGSYTRVVWLAQTADPVERAELRALAESAAERIGLPLTVIDTGHGGLRDALADLLESCA